MEVNEGLGVPLIDGHECPSYFRKSLTISFHMLAQAEIMPDIMAA